MGIPKGGTNTNHSKKKLTPIEQLKYKVALLERELLKKNGEIIRLKNP